MVVKVMDSWLAFYEFEPSAAEDTQCRGGRCTLNLLRSKHPTIGVMGKLGERVPDQVSSSSLDLGSKLRGSSPVTLV
ncbi:hypothetical protein TNCV_5051521 [Trichonephila clavipes]|nr:hypothetical protein TNCV_5051521 [Trichonephila clavipes]